MTYNYSLKRAQNPAVMGALTETHAIVAYDYPTMLRENHPQKTMLAQTQS